MTDHPTLEELQQFCRGGLEAERFRTLVRHLLRGCRRCGSLLMPEVNVIFGLPRQEKEIPAGAYNAMFDRLLSNVDGRDSGAGGGAQERQGIPETADEEASRVLVVSHDGSFTGPPAFVELLDRCQTLRYDDPSRMVELARFAAFFADRLDVRQYGAQRVADLRCRGWTELANAYRVAERLHESEEALEIAAECQVEGTGEELLGARMLEIQASLDADRRCFPEALNSLDEVHAIYLRRGDRHLAGRTLIKKGLYAGYDCDPELGIRLLEEGLTLIDRERDPELARSAIQNLSRSLMECGRLEEAKELLQRVRHSDTDGRVGRLRLAWLEAEIDAGLNHLAKAEQGLKEVHSGFEEMDLRYKAALVNLELAAVHLRQGRTDDARERAQQATEVFSRLGIGRETFASLLVLRDAFETRVVSGALLEGVIGRLVRMERESGV